MENKRNNSASIQDTIAESLQNFANMSMSAVKSNLENTSKNFTEMNRLMQNVGIGPIKLPFLNQGKSDCCAPKHECPPHCLTHINRSAFARERIIVPFMVKNTCSHARQYRVGVRELKNIDGSVAPAQPELNKNMVSLQPGQSELVLMAIDLDKFQPGTSYNTEVVLREKEINQNICFSLNVDAYNNVPLVEPVDEKKYSLRWQSWQSHFYCEPPKKLMQDNS